MKKNRRFRPDYLHLLAVLSFMVLASCKVSGADTLRIKGDYLRSADTIIIYSPETTRGLELPVLFLMAGRDMSASSWKQYADLQEMADTLAWIIICPGTGNNSWYLNSPADTQSRYTDHFFRELLPALEQWSDSSLFRDLVFITGLEMGGYGALNLSLEDPDLFNACGAIYPVFDLGEFSVDPDKFRQLLGDGFGNAFLRQSFSISPRLGKIANSALALHISIQEDADLEASWKNFREACSLWNVDMTYSVSGTGNDQVLQELVRQVNAFRKMAE